VISAQQCRTPPTAPRAQRELTYRFNVLRFSWQVAAAHRSAEVVAAPNPYGRHARPPRPASLSLSFPDGRRLELRRYAASGNTCLIHRRRICSRRRGRAAGGDAEEEGDGCDSRDDVAPAPAG
jgi:hypothetical protein